MCISGSTSAWTRLDKHFTVLAQALLLFQQPGHLLPVKLDVRVVFEDKQKSLWRTRSWSSGLPSCRRHVAPYSALICPWWPVLPLLGCAEADLGRRAAFKPGLSLFCPLSSPRPLRPQLVWELHSSLADGKYRPAAAEWWHWWEEPWKQQSTLF